MGFLKKLGGLFTANTETQLSRSPTTAPKPVATPKQPRGASARDVPEPPAPLADPHCPYCGHEFNSPPKAKKKCPACGNHVRVRWRTDGKRHLIREDQLAEVEAELLIDDDNDDDPDAAYTIRTKIVGVSHDNDDGTSRQKLVADCKVGEKLKLKHKPVPQDRNAVAVYRGNGKQLGWLSREVAADVASDLDDDFTLICEITDLTGGTLDKPTRGCNIQITMK